MRRTEEAEITVLCLIYRGDEVLLQNRVKEDWKGYTLPGGHVEPGESFIEAVKREMKEETGLTIRQPSLCGIKQFPIENGRYLVFLYKTDEFEGELVPSEEGDVEWVRRSELSRCNLVPDFAELLRVFDEKTLSEFQYIVHGEEWIPVVR
jgi:8-oxo-dGTP diphosphatase